MWDNQWGWIYEASWRTLVYNISLIIGKLNSRERGNSSRAREEVKLNVINRSNTYKIYKKIIETEYKWSLFEDEKTEVIMEVGDIIFENLIDEIASFIQLKW